MHSAAAAAARLRQKTGSGCKGAPGTPLFRRSLSFYEERVKLFGRTPGAEQSGGLSYSTYCNKDDTATPPSLRSLCSHTLSVLLPPSSSSFSRQTKIATVSVCTRWSCCMYVTQSYKNHSIIKHHIHYTGRPVGKFDSLILFPVSTAYTYPPQMTVCFPPKYKHTERPQLARG